MRVVNESSVRSTVMFLGWCAEHWSDGRRTAALVPTALICDAGIRLLFQFKSSTHGLNEE